MSTTDFSPEELARYDRQLLLPQLGREGQEKLRRGRVLVVGAGGLGSPATLYLAAAGVGTLGVLDADAVELSNLQRQIIHGTGMLGVDKTVSAERRLRDLNPHVNVVPIQKKLTADNAKQLCADYDVILGCVDNFAARYHINSACVSLGLPNVFGSAARFEGQASVFSHAGGPCYRCFFRDPPPDDWRPGPEDKAVIGTAPGVIGCIQANEAIKLLLGVGDCLSGRLLLYDALRMSFRELKLRRDDECPVCGKGSQA